MLKHALVAGTGQMAEEIGLLLLGRGYAVSWISHSPERGAAFRPRMMRLVQRAARAHPGIERGVRGFLGMNELDGLSADLVIETTVESEEAKREVLQRLAARVGAEGAVFSNTSSILPAILHPRCIGVHFFRPILLTGFVEAIFPAGCSAVWRERTRLILQSLGLCWIEQDETTAFAANRLLLPVQAECFRLLLAGHLPVAVDSTCRSSLLPVGPLALMDAIGLDVVAGGARRYLARMADDRVGDLGPLATGLDQLLALGKLGNKNGDGLLRGTPLPWAGSPPSEGAALAAWLPAVAMNACALAVDDGMVSLQELDLILTRVFQAQGPFVGLVKEASRRGWPELLAHHYRQTGIWYYRPALEPFMVGNG